MVDRARSRLSTPALVLVVCWEKFWYSGWGMFAETAAASLLSVAALAVLVRLTDNSFADFNFIIVIILLVNLCRVIDRRSKLR